MVNKVGSPRPNYQELRVEDQPTAKLHFLEPDDQGTEVWWEYPLTVELSRPGKTFLYTVKPPKSIRMPGLVPRWIETEGRNLVISVKVKSVLEVPMSYVENFQVTNARFDTAAVVSQQTQQIEAEEPVMAQPSEDPADIKSRSEISATALSDLSPEAQAQVAKLKDRVDQASAEGTVTFGMVQERPLNRDQDAEIRVGDQKVGKIEEWQALEEQLNNVWKKARR